ncbi:ribonuclease H-like domain-containing protein [Xylariaceae sp. FL0662B]|nr:ribonuclease H-like domain-containing protein [Xylariaceae sp. FL0662B]
MLKLGKAKHILSCDNAIFSRTLSSQKSPVDRKAIPSDDGLIDTPSLLSSVIDALDGLPTTPPSLYIDLEGVRLSRHGSVSILQLHVPPINRTYLIDIKTLDDKAFSTAGKDGLTLKTILESNTTPKVIFDVRSDSDALYSHFEVSLDGIHDLQLMELATRRSRKSLVSGLSRCIERDASLTIHERIAWNTTKETGIKLFAPERGGSYEVFNERPLSSELRLYCIKDVQLLPQLWMLYNSRMTPAWKTRVSEATKGRIAESQAAHFNGVGKHMAIAPSGWQYL